MGRLAHERNEVLLGMRHDVHVLDDALESYVMGKLQGEQLDKIEDHLLVCPHCQSRAKQTQQYVEATRIAAERIRTDQFFRPSAQPWWRGWIRPVMAHRGWAAAGALALGMVFALSSMRLPGIEYREVALQTTRGVDSGTNLATGRNVRVRLKLDLTSVSKLQLYQVQVVDADGNPVWQTQAKPASDGNLIVPVEQRLAKGKYWVRVAEPGQNRTLLREYPLQLE